MRSAFLLGNIFILYLTNTKDRHFYYEIQLYSNYILVYPQILLA